MISKLIKFTDADYQSGHHVHKPLKWGIETTHQLESRPSPNLCSPDLIHAYRDLNLALLTYRLHLEWHPEHLFEAEGEIVASQWDKVGVFSLTTVKEIPFPDWYLHHRKQVCIKFATSCAYQALKNIHKHDACMNPKLNQFLIGGIYTTQVQPHLSRCAEFILTLNEAKVFNYTAQVAGLSAEIDPEIDLINLAATAVYVTQ